MVSPFLLAVPVTIVPAMGVLWYLLKRYEGYFEDARVFFSLTVGFFAGLVAVGFETFIFPFGNAQFIEEMGWWTAMAFFVGGYAFFETGAKVIVLGLRRFRGRKDTPYYGAALGLGFGAMSSLTFVSLAFQAAQIQQGEIAQSDMNMLIAVSILVPLGSIFAHGATGVHVGLGAANGELAKGWIRGTFMLTPILGCYWILFTGSAASASRLLITGAMAIVYGVVLLVLTRKRVLDEIVPPEIAAQVRRDRRRQLRAEALGREYEPSNEPAMAGLATATGAAASGAADIEDEPARRVDVGAARIIDIDSEE